MKVSDRRAQAVACSSLRFVPLLLSKVLIAQKNCHNNLQRIACRGVVPPYIESPSLATCCMNKHNKLQCTSCTALIWGTCKQPVYTAINTYCIAGNFRGRKLSRISWFCAYLRIFIGETWGQGVLWCGTREQSVKVFSAKLYFSPIRESFLPLKFPAIQYLLTFFCPITAEVCIVHKMAQDVGMMWKYCSVISV